MRSSTTPSWAPQGEWKCSRVCCVSNYRCLLEAFSFLCWVLNHCLRRSCINSLRVWISRKPSPFVSQHESTKSASKISRFFSPVQVAEKSPSSGPGRSPESFRWSSMRSNRLKALLGCDVGGVDQTWSKAFQTKLSGIFGGTDSCHP